jgi:hypothetical protein
VLVVLRAGVLTDMISHVNMQTRHLTQGAAAAAAAADGHDSCRSVALRGVADGFEHKCHVQ